MANPKREPQDLMCGMMGWRPTWLQPFATARSFLIVFGFLGSIQMMSFLYFTITLTTLEKRFKIPSSSTGIVLSGNEISQILLSLVLSYFGGQRNRPKWIAWGGIISGCSCFLLALGHFFFGPGEDAIKLTREYMYSQDVDANFVFNLTVSPKLQSVHQLCIDTPDVPDPDEDFSLAPLIMIFMSQFVLGVGTTLYYTLGSPYLDDGTAKKNTPMMLAYTMSFRIIGLIFGFGLVAGTMRVYIDPWSTPLIDDTDPRWMGAWWLGWYILGGAMVVSSLFIGLFPRELPKKVPKVQKQIIRDEKSTHFEEEKPLQDVASIEALDESDTFFVALKRLLKNKLLIFNIISSIFYLLGSSVFITYFSKYLEVQFNKNSAESSMLTGPATILSMVSGIMISGYVISKFQPSPKKLLFFNVIVGFAYMSGQFSNLFLYCDSGSFFTDTGLVNLTTTCNMNCSCTGVPYSPVCDEASGTTFFSPCHAGCKSWSDSERKYTDCGCVKNDSNFTNSPWSLSTSTLRPDGNIANRQFGASNSGTTQQTEETTEKYVEGADSSYDYDDTESASTEASREKRSADNPDFSITPGVCLAGCGYMFLTYTLISCFINWLGSAARIGNVLVNFRAVPVRDKSFAQGLSLCMISLFAMIPGPILFGYIIDSTCLIFNDNHGTQGNCQIYDQKQFRHVLNWWAMALTGIGTGFDFLVWWYGRDLQLYTDQDEIVAPVEDTKRPKV